jgi:hypothetical protein
MPIFWGSSRPRFDLDRDAARGDGLLEDCVVFLALVRIRMRVRR